MTKQLLNSRSAERGSLIQQSRKLFRLQELTWVAKWVDESLRSVIVNEILIRFCGCEVYEPLLHSFSPFTEHPGVSMQTVGQPTKEVARLGFRVQEPADILDGIAQENGLRRKNRVAAFGDNHETIFARPASCV